MKSWWCEYQWQGRMCASASMDMAMRGAKNLLSVENCDGVGLWCLLVNTQLR